MSVQKQQVGGSSGKAGPASAGKEICLTGGTRYEGVSLLVSSLVVLGLASLLVGLYLGLLEAMGGMVACCAGVAVKYWLMTLSCLNQLLSTPLASSLIILLSAGRSFITPAGALPADLGCVPYQVSLVKAVQCALVDLGYLFLNSDMVQKRLPGYSDMGVRLSMPNSHRVLAMRAILSSPIPVGFSME